MPKIFSYSCFSFTPIPYQIDVHYILKYLITIILMIVSVNTMSDWQLSFNADNYNLEQELKTHLSKKINKTHLSWAVSATFHFIRLWWGVRGCCWLKTELQRLEDVRAVYYLTYNLHFTFMLTTCPSRHSSLWILVYDNQLPKQNMSHLPTNIWVSNKY